MPEVEIGHITHYFGNIGVAAIQLTGGDLALGDTLHIKGHTSDFSCQVDTMEIDRQGVSLAKQGAEVGLKVPQPVRTHDRVFKVIA